MELVNAILDSSLIAAVVALAGGTIIGGRITTALELKRKRREIEFAAAADFYASYGEFFAIWKEWEATGAGKFEAERRQENRRALFVRACAAEGKVEALLAKLAAERVLTEDQARRLGCFRQAYQTLRKAIQNDRGLGMAQRGAGQQIDDPWYSSKAESYVAFKALAMSVAHLIDQPTKHRPTPDRAASSLQQITSNEHEAPQWLTWTKDNPDGTSRRALTS